MKMTRKIYDAFCMAVRVYPMKQLDFGIIAHPLVTSIFAFDDGSSSAYQITPDNFEQEVEKRLQKVKGIRTVEVLLAMVVNKPFRLDFLSYLDNFLDRKTYSRLLMHIWTETEFPHLHRSNFDLVRMFDRADALFLMEDKDDRDFYKSLPETVEVYRGIPNKKTRVRALSWTTSVGMAWWFADRWGEKGNVYAAKIRKIHVLATVAGSEFEVIVNPQYLYNIHRLDWRDPKPENPSYHNTEASQ